MREQQLTSTNTPLPRDSIENFTTLHVAEMNSQMLTSTDTLPISSRTGDILLHTNVIQQIYHNESNNSGKKKEYNQ
jgi:hypothetical protein